MSLLISFSLWVAILLSTSTPAAAQDRAVAKCSAKHTNNMQAWSDCCPAADKKQATLSRPTYSFAYRCNTGVKPTSEVGIHYADPTECARRCSKMSECIASYWQRDSEICYLVVGTSEAGSIAMIPPKKSDDECQRKLKAECTRCCKACQRKVEPPPRVKAPDVGCGTGTVYGPYRGHHYAAYTGCSGGGNPIGALKITSDKEHQKMEYCVQRCAADPRCVLAIRERRGAASSPASRCSLKSSQGRMFRKGDDDLIIRIK
jgi:hypothetical protein